MIIEDELPFAEEAQGTVERCVAEVILGIRKGSLRPSHKLGEESFAKKLQVDRSSVRLAFDRLVTAGLLERVHRSGTFVRRIDFQEFCNTAEVRAVLEGLAGVLASQRASDADLKALGSLADKLDRFASQLLTNRHNHNGMQHLEVMEMDFHTKLAHLSGNPVLCRVLSFHHLISLCFMVGLVNRSPDAVQGPSIPSHVEIVTALISRNSSEAGQIIRNHILLAKNAAIRQASNLQNRTESLKPHQ